MALTTNLVNGRRAKAHRRQLNMAPARAGEIFYVGSVISIDAAGRIVNGAGGVLAAGIAVEPIFPEEPRKNVHLDNRNGSDGEWQGDRCQRCVRYDQVGEYRFTNVLGAPVVGGLAYVVDDDTVSADPIAAGIVLGEFTQNKDGGWYVDIGKKNAGLRATVDAPIDLVAPVWATLAPDSPPVGRSDVIQFSLTNRGDFTVQAGAENAGPSFFGIAAQAAVAGDKFLIWRGGYYPVRFKDGETLPAYTILTWENTGARWIQLGDVATIGRSLEASTGGVGEIVMCEIWWPPQLKLQ